MDGSVCHCPQRSTAATSLTRFQVNLLGQHTAQDLEGPIKYAEMQGLLPRKVCFADICGMHDSLREQQMEMHTPHVGIE